jgi:phage recombination protein Bet
MNAAMRRRAFHAASRPLAEALAFKPGDVFPLRSRSRPGHRYEMTVTPEGRVVHDGEGCEGEPYNGPEGCWHSKDTGRYVMTTAVTQYEATPPPMVFTEEHKKTLKNTICRGASDSELQLFIYACQDVGLNPFLKQIWAIQRNINVGTSQNPKYEKQLTIQVGIDGYRAIRDRLIDKDGAALFEGMDGPQWSDDGTEWLDYPFNEKPKFARVAVWRRGIPRPFTAVCRFDAYNQGNAMWKTMGPEQLAKCAEALAYRRAFPAQMGKLPSGPIADYDEIAEPEQPAGFIEGTAREIEPPSPPITDEQRKAIAKVWNPRHHNIENVRAVNPRAFPQPGAGSNDTKVLSYDEACAVIALLSEKPETPVSASAGAVEGVGNGADTTPKAGTTSPACDHEYAFNEDTTLLTCLLCGDVQDAPPAEQPAQGALV